jgi:CRP-like cAMP-binding protein
VTGAADFPAGPEHCVGFRTVKTAVGALSSNVARGDLWQRALEASVLSPDREGPGVTESVTKNQLLAALPPAVLSRLLPRMHHVTLTVRNSIMVPDADIEAVYFVESGWVSLVMLLEDGAQAEVGIVGREGMVGLPLITGVDTSFVDAYAQADGTALSMDAASFRRAMVQEADFRRLLLRYLEATIAQITQTAACNGRHGLEQRLARWLLMAHDRADSDNLQITQEFLSMMLCVYRPTVSVAARALQRAGIIRIGRGRITVLDREALEACACDCYGIVKKRIARLLGS